MSRIEMINQKNSDWLRYHKKRGKTFNLSVELYEYICSMYENNLMIAQGIGRSMNQAVSQCANNFVEGQFEFLRD